MYKDTYLIFDHISFPEDPTELTIVRNALTSLFKMEPKGKLLNTYYYIGQLIKVDIHVCLDILWKQR